jgi:hypothetical protein
MIFLIFFTIIIVYLYISTKRKPHELPGKSAILIISIKYPIYTHYLHIYVGPFKWPIVGNLPQIAKINWSRVWHAIDYYSTLYGEIYGIYFGPRYVGKRWGLE